MGCTVSLPGRWRYYLAALASLIGASTVNWLATQTRTANTTVAEPLLSYELDKLFRSARRPNVDMGAERAEAERILMMSSSHNGVSNDDRAYLVQQVAATAGLSLQESERRVDASLRTPRRPLPARVAARS